MINCILFQFERFSMTFQAPAFHLWSTWEFPEEVAQLTFKQQRHREVLYVSSSSLSNNHVSLLD